MSYTVIKGAHSPLEAIGDAVYTNHSDTVADPDGNLYQAWTVQRTSNHVDVVVIKRERGSGVYSPVHTFTQLQYGKNGYASLAVVGKHLVVLLSSRDDEGTKILPEEWIIINVLP